MTKQGQKPATGLGVVQDVGAVEAALIPFVVGSVIGFGFTAFPSMSVSSWPVWVGIRIALQFGTAAWLAYVLAQQHRGRLRANAGTLLVVLAIGLLLSYNSVRSAVGGATTVEGIVVEYDVAKGFKSSLHADLGVESDDGTITRIDPSGNQARTMIDALGPCARKGARVRVTLLVPLDAVLAAECLTPGHGRS